MWNKVYGRDEPVVLAGPVLSESIHCLARRTPVLRIEPRNLAVPFVGETVDRVGSPAGVEMLEEGERSFPVVVIELLTDSVGFRVKLPWNPYHTEIDLIFLTN